MKRLVILGVAILAVLPGAGTALGEAAVRAAELKVFGQRLDGVRKIHQPEMEELIVVYGVDPLSWFCDLRDAIDSPGLRRLRYLLRRGGTAFHVKSMAMRSSRELKPLIEDFQN